MKKVSLWQWMTVVGLIFAPIAMAAREPLAVIATFLFCFLVNPFTEDADCLTATWKVFLTGIECHVISVIAVVCYADSFYAVLGSIWVLSILLCAHSFIKQLPHGYGTSFFTYAPNIVRG